MIGSSTSVSQSATQCGRFKYLFFPLVLQEHALATLRGHEPYVSLTCRFREEGDT